MIYIKIEIIFLLLIQYSNIGSACPDGMKLFLDEEGLPECFSCRKCPVDAKKVGNCTYEHDTICDDCTGSEFYDDRSLHCKTCTVCNAGYYVRRNCSTFKDTVCDVCPNGTFSLVQNSSSCTNCTDCRGTQIITKLCQRTADTVCEQIDEENETIQIGSIILLVVSIVVSLCLMCFCMTHALRIRRKEHHRVTEKCQHLRDSEHSQETTENAYTSLQEFKRHLKDVYRSMLTGHKDVIFGEPYAEFNMTYEIPGSLQPSEVKHIKEMFYENGKAVKRICVIGDASIGKTTLCKSLVHDYCNSDAQKNHLRDSDQGFDWLFFISMRHFRSLFNVLDMIKCRYFQKANTLLSEILEKDETVLVILDGYDEWKVPQSEENNFSLDFANFDDLQNCTVLITTRPLAWTKSDSSDTSQGCYREITMRNITETAAATFKREIVDNLRMGKDEEIIQPYIDDTNITSQPLLLKQLVRLHCKDNIRKHPNEPLCKTLGKIILNWLKDVDFIDETGHRCEQRLPECLDTEKQSHKLLLSLLSKVSFDILIGQVTNRVQWETLRHVGFSKYMIESCQNIGLLSYDLDSCNEQDNVRSVGFPHIRYLEFFTAVYIFMNQESVDIFLEKCKTAKQITSLRFVVLFVSEMKSPAMKTIFKKMNEILENETVDNEFSKLDDRLSLQSLALDCVDQQQTLAYFNLKNIYICFDCLDEKRMSILQRLMNSTFISSVNIYYRRGPKPTIPITTMFNTFNEALKKSNDLQNVTMSLYKKLDYTTEKKLLETIKMKSITLTTIKLKGLGCEPYFEYLQCRKVSNLRHLHISDIKLSHTEKQSLMTYVAKAVGVQELVLIDIRCKDHEQCGQCPCPLELSKYSQLKRLTLKQVQLGWVRVNTSSLTDCLATDTPVFYDPDKDNFRSSTELHLENIEHECDIKAVADLLPSLYQLTRLSICSSNFGNKYVRLPKTAVSLKMIEMVKVNMANDKLLEFINSIPENKNEIVCKFINIIPLHTTEKISKRYDVEINDECRPYGYSITVKTKPKPLKRNS